MKITTQHGFLAKVILGALVVLICADTSWAVLGVWRRTARRAVVVGSAATATAATASAASANAAASQQAAAQSSQAAAQPAAAPAPAPAQTAAQTAPAPAPAPAQAAAAPAGAPPIGSTVTALPQGCVASPKNGVEYQNCGGVYYRAAFQGDSLIYVVVPQP